MTLIRLAPVLFSLIALPARADLPPEALAATEEAMALCREAGGNPQVTPDYEAVVDLNGDGVPDHLTNLMGLQCEGAWSVFCGSVGCPVTAWLSRPDGSHTDFAFGNLQSVEVVASPDGGGPAVRAFYHGAFCGDGRAGVDGCVRLWTFPAGAAPVEWAEAATAGFAQAGPEPAPPPPAGPSEVAPGWTLRDVPGSTPVALGGGMGEIAWFAGFCLQSQPFLTLMFDPPRATETVTLRFAFGDGPVEAPAVREPTAGGAHVIALAGTPLAARLAGRDSRVDVTLDASSMGTLSLAGSSRALRAALGACHGF
jgi:hypothetical protein